MHIRILGSAAGGRFPQWNCACPNCKAVRAGDPMLTARSQDAIAISSDGRCWFVFNASADILQQIEDNPPLHPRGPRDTPIAGILLGNGDLDHVLGLLGMRESQPLHLYATDAVRTGLVEDNGMFRTLQRFDGHTTWHRLSPGQPLALTYPDGSAAGLTLTPFAAPGKRPIHLEQRGAPSADDNIGFHVHEPKSGRTCVYATAVAELDGVLPWLERADCVLLDGTFWTDDELIRLSLGEKRARDMAHLPVGGPDGSLLRLSHLKARRKIYTHINNTNPMLRMDSAERRAVVDAGWEIADDALEITL